MSRGYFNFDNVSRVDFEKLKYLWDKQKILVVKSEIFVIESDVVVDYSDNLDEISISIIEELKEETVRKMINVVKKIYFVLKKSGFGKDDNDNLDESEVGKDGEYTSHIWAVNLFRPQEVKKYGRKKLLNAPCDHIEAWKDGAMFMMINRNNFASTYQERKRLREYLNEK